MSPEDNPADDVQPTREEWQDYERRKCQLRKCWREGCDANDHNRNVYRLGNGIMRGNPYGVGSDDWKEWRDGYAYRDMVNDG